eukprot:gene21444-1204_t
MEEKVKASIRLTRDVSHMAAELQSAGEELQGSARRLERLQHQLEEEQRHYDNVREFVVREETNQARQFEGLAAQNELQAYGAVTPEQPNVTLLSNPNMTNPNLTNPNVSTPETPATPYGHFPLTPQAQNLRQHSPAKEVIDISSPLTAASPTAMSSWLARTERASAVQPLD